MRAIHCEQCDTWQRGDREVLLATDAAGRVIRGTGWLTLTWGGDDGLDFCSWKCLSIFADDKIKGDRQ